MLKPCFCLHRGDWIWARMFGCVNSAQPQFGMLTTAQRSTVSLGCMNLLGGLHFHLVCKERLLPTCPCLNLIKSRTVGSLIWNNTEIVQSVSSHNTCHSALVFIVASLWPSMVKCAQIFSSHYSASPTPALLFPFGIELSPVTEGKWGICLKISSFIFLSSPEKNPFNRFPK